MFLLCRFLMLALIAAVSLFSLDQVDNDFDSIDQIKTAPVTEQGLLYVQGEGIAKEDMSSGYNAPGRIDLRGNWDSYFELSCIYWQALEEELYVAKSNISSTTNYPTDLKYYSMDFDFKPGLKFVIGHCLNNHDDWDFLLRYIGLHLKDKVAYANSEYVTIPCFYTGGSSIYISQIVGKWRLNFDMLDLEMGRSFYMGTRLITRPFAGLKGGYIKQKYHNKITDYNVNIGTYHPYYHGKLESWKIGMKLGCNSQWFLSQNFKIDANLAFDLLYADFKTIFDNFLYSTTYNTTYNLTGTKNSKLVQPGFELSAGFGWGSYFLNYKMHFNIAVLYEFQVYLRENQLLFEQVYGDQGGLYLHGLTVTGRLDF